ncbi:diguanylate cyclase domain-containing protein [Marinicella sediminis]|uniref:Diguanylate cyclase domain-containing protein n=1 Tax=Marinicella sediminis TaxID=1792834 RepID=A0ABV7JCG3_9GAMM|nr:GGDEF domain-containing protein [Marinicella sediminis]
MKKTGQVEMKLIDQLMDSLLWLWVMLSSFGLWFSLSRAEITGWGAREYFHIGFYVLIFLVTLLRKRISPYLKAMFFVVFQSSIAVIGVMSFGLLAPSIIFLPMIVVILALFFHHNLIILVSLGVLIFVALSGYAFQMGYWQLPADANTLFYSPEHWFLYVVCLTIFLLFVAIAIFQYRQYNHQLIGEITRQKIEIEHLANHDYLTGLPMIQLAINTFERFIGQSDGEPPGMAVLFLDLDKFKLVNDHYGHDAGDICLIHVANKISRELKHEGFVCRLGGDEFLIILPGFSEIAAIKAKAERLLAAVADPFMFRGRQLSIGASIGIALYPNHGEKFQDLKRAADRAMYRAKLSADDAICVALD